MSGNTNEVQKSLSGALGTLIVKVFGPTSEFIGEELADRISVWRTQNLEKLAARVRAKEEVLLLTEDVEVSDGFKLLTFEAASSEENEEVLDLWAELIIEAKKGEIGKDYKPLIETLREFTPLMALCLAAFSNQKISRVGAEAKVTINPEKQSHASRLSQYTDEQIFVALDQLKRLNLIRPMRMQLRLRFNSGGQEGDIASAKALELVADKVQQTINEPEIPFSRAVKRFQKDELVLVGLFFDETELGKYFCRILKLGNSKLGGSM